MTGWLFLLAALAAFAAGDFISAGAFLLTAGAISFGLSEW
jgi:hypothetical protein